MCRNKTLFAGSLAWRHAWKPAVQAAAAGNAPAAPDARLEQLGSELSSLRAQVQRLRSEPGASHAFAQASEQESAILARKPMRGYRRGPSCALLSCMRTAMCALGSRMLKAAVMHR
jgi:hypothetical protein